MSLLIPALFDLISDQTRPKWDDIMDHLLQMNIVPIPLIQTLVDDTSSLSTFCNILFKTSHFKSLLDITFKTSGKLRLQDVHSSLMSLLIPALFDLISDQTRPKWDDIMDHLLQMNIVPIPLIQTLVDDTSSLSTFCNILFKTSHFKSLLDITFKTSGKLRLQDV
eukprot:510586_1